MLESKLNIEELSQSPTRFGRIDIHHHLIPPSFAETLQKKGISQIAGASIPVWNSERSIEVMNMNGIQTAILSLSSPGVYFGNIPEAVSLARQCNEFAAELKSKYSGRFGSFAVLPMPFTDLACREATYALDTLNAEGVVLLGSTEGIFLGDTSLDELMEELNKRKAIVFVHPNLHVTSQELKLKTPGFMVEFICDTTRAAVNLIFSGTLEKYPDIKWILSHAGGFLPYVGWRISLGNLMSEFAGTVPQGVMHYIRRFYYDTALSASPYAMASLKELVDPSHILFGSDFPFAAAPLIAIEVHALDNLTIWNDNIKHRINRGYALNLFPAYKEENETTKPLPVYGQLQMRDRVRRVLMKPLLYLAEKIRSR